MTTKEILDVVLVGKPATFTLTTENSVYRDVEIDGPYAYPQRIYVNGQKILFSEINSVQLVRIK